MGKDKGEKKEEKSDKEEKRDSLNAQLRMAGQRGNLSLMKEVLEEKKLVDINNQDGLGNTALHYAAQACHLNVLTHLLEHEADANVQNALGETALHKACHKNFIDGCEALLKHGADPNIKTKDKKKPHHVTTNPTVKKLLDKAEKTTTKVEEIDMSMLADAADRDD